jgi:hypothetical protein
MEVSGHLHTAAALPPVRIELGGPQSRSGRCEIERILLILPRIELRQSISSEIMNTDYKRSEIMNTNYKRSEIMSINYKLSEIMNTNIAHALHLTEFSDAFTLFRNHSEEKKTNVSVMYALSNSVVLT